MQSTQTQTQTWLDQPISALFKLNWEIIIFIVLLLAAVLTRFYKLEYRVMSHDETSHTYFSWLLSTGKGYAHDPVTHGPFQFHIVALSYFLFGDSDTSARIPVVLFNIATIAFVWQFRRYLGRWGALAAGVMLLISPFILYYGRYVRNESFVGLYFVLMIWAMLRYYETGQKKYMYALTLANIMHFVTKETSYIYAAQFLLFSGLYFLYTITRKPWLSRQSYTRFLVFLLIAFVLFGGGFGYHELVFQPNAQATILEGDAIPPTAGAPITMVLIGVGGLALIGALYYLVTGYGTDNLREDRSFSLMFLQFVLLLPLLSAFGINFLGWKIPINATEVNALTTGDMVHMAYVIVPAFIVSILAGLWWNRREWLINAGIFWAIFVVLYTTFFTNGPGFFTGLVGSLGYWLAQQDVNRGSQPYYYYWLVQIPMYEFLPALGAIGAIIIRLLQHFKGKFLPPVSPGSDEPDANFETVQLEPVPTFSLLLFWSITSLAAYTIAGEKMPWLTYHITLPFIFLSAWGLNAIITTTDWQALKNGKAWLVLLLMPVFVTSLTAVMTSVLASPIRPFQGKSLQELSATSTFVFSLIVALGVAALLSYLLKDWSMGQISRFFVLSIVGLLAILTARASFRASYVNGNNATEYLVYAHCGPGIKIALNQIEEISRRTTGSLDMVVAYDNLTTYPYWWYLRNFPNQRYYGTTPTREQLRDAPVILVGDRNLSKVEPIVGQAYDRFDYIRIWWPNQDYYDLTWDRVANALLDPAMRSAIFDIWLNRNYSAYASLTQNQNLSLSTWTPSETFHLFIRKDITAKIWQYGSSTTTQPIVADPYEGKGVSLQADISLPGGNQNISFNRPRSVAVAPDGSVYVADSGNNRILHFSPDMQLLQSWGQAGDVSKNTGSPGTFNEPWSIAVGPDGSVYVADTWNHRIQKFTADGQFIKMWGTIGQAERPDAFWGPRAVAVDSENRVYVTDTGNKRVVIFDSEGNYISQFGSAGAAAGMLDEPVGLAVDSSGKIYIADTWNQRVQVFEPATGGNFNPIKEWPIVGWYGESLDNKPYIAVDDLGNVYVTDPEGNRVLEFKDDGTFIRFWGDAGTDAAHFNLPIGLAYDHQGGLWVADSANNRVQHFKLTP